MRTVATGATVLASTTSGGAAAGSAEAMLAGGGRYLAFQTGTAISGADGNGTDDVYVRDLQTGAVDLVSRIPASSAMGGTKPSISDDGARVAFGTSASGTGADTNGQVDAYVYDRTTDQLELGSRQNGAGGGAPLTGETLDWMLSGDGTTLAFSSGASDLSDGGPVGAVHRRILGTTVTQLVSRASGPSGAAANGFANAATIDDTGTVFAFGTDASNLDPAPNATGGHAYVRRVVAAQTERVSVRDDGSPMDAVSSAVLSGDGQHVVVARAGTQSGLDGPAPDLDVRTGQLVERDLTATPRRTRSVSRPAGSSSQIPPLHETLGTPAFSANGRYVAFLAEAAGYLPAGTQTRLGVCTGAIS